MTDVKTFINKLKSFSGGYKQEAIAFTNNFLANEIYQKSQAACPVLTGYLKGTGYQQSSADGFEVGYTADYAVYVNYGTSRMAPRPFLTDAVKEVNATAKSIYSANLKKFWNSVR